MLIARPIRYKAFLSYSHKDAVWASWLQKALETYSVDRDLVGRETAFGQIPPTLRPVFVDRDDFASGPSPKGSNTTSDQSFGLSCSHLLPACTRKSACERRIRLFKASGGSSRIVPIIVGGEPGDPNNECFPSALRFDSELDSDSTPVPIEPIAADARDIADGRELAKLKVIAGLLGVGLDEIRKRAARAARRRVIILGVTAAVMAILAIVAGGEAWIAQVRKNEAEARLNWALEAANSITAKAATFKGKFGVPAPVIAELLTEVERLLGRLSDQGVNSSELEAREAALLGALSDGNVDGNTAKALIDAQRAEAKLHTLASQTQSQPNTKSISTGGGSKSEISYLNKTGLMTLNKTCQQNTRCKDWSKQTLEI